MAGLLLVGQPVTDSRWFYLSGVSVLVVGFIARPNSKPPAWMQLQRVWRWLVCGDSR